MFYIKYIYFIHLTNLRPNMRVSRALGIIFSLIFTNSLLFAQTDDFLQFLNKKLPASVSIEKAETSAHFKNAYTLYIDQPIDHNNPSLGSFKQRVFVSHFDRKAPTLFVTEGYSARPRVYELSKILRSNQIIVEYRYNGASAPESLDYKYLTNDQAMEDLHRIRMLFKKIYKKKWISTGISKGGTTCLIYKSKYPNDVDVSVSYVGPLPKAREDDRMDKMIMEKMAETSCGKKIDQLQKFALKHDDEIIPKIDSLAKADKITFNRVSTAQAIEFAVLELTFSFLQMGYSCNDVPKKLTVNSVFNYLKKIVGFDFYCDQTIDYFEPAFYQFMTENGYYGFIHKPFEGLLDDLDQYDNEIFAPQGIPLEFDKDYMTRVRVFLHHFGDKVIYIQGGNDPWAACRFVPPAERDAVYIEKEGASHSLRIAGLDQDQQQEIYDALKRWLRVKIYPLASE